MSTSILNQFKLIAKSLSKMETLEANCRTREQKQKGDLFFPLISNPKYYFKDKVIVH
jgi:hypothetical protein